MNVTAVESTTLSTIAYDDARDLLQLEFRSGAVYQYFDVPAAVHSGLLRASSKGTYFRRMIRGCFAYARATKAQPDVLGSASLSESSLSESSC